MPLPVPIWTQEDREKVAEMLRAGATATEVGKAFGISRNAAVGRILRIPYLAELWRRCNLGQGGLHPNNPRKAASARGPSPAPKPAPDHEPAPVAVSVAKNWDIRHIFGEWPPGWEEREAHATRQSVGVPLLELGLCQCRWAVDELFDVPGRHLFCGQPTRLEAAYCEPHMERARAR